MKSMQKQYTRQFYVLKRKIQMLQARRQEATQRILSAYQKPQINHERNLQYIKESQMARDKARQQEDHKERIAVLKMQQQYIFY